MRLHVILAFAIVLTFFCNGPTGLSLANAGTTCINTHALYMYGESRDQTKVDQVLAALNSPDHYVRRIAVRALGKIGHKKSITPLIQILNSQNENPMVRSLAAWALGAMNAGQALDALTLCLDNEPIISQSARKAISKIAGHYTMLANL
jgi:HEAT repeat protein